jgi:hypothetical protein
MPTAADFEPELVDALNLLIEDERASVEMEIALASGATEYTERDTLARMGAEDIHSCETLRAEMESAGLQVTPQINGVVFEVLGAERYDDRLRSFAHHQRIVADRAADLLESNLDGELREALARIVETHERHIEWASARADAFAATRLLEFGPRQPAAPEPAPAEPAGEMATPDVVAAPEPAAPDELPAIDAALPAIVPVEEMLGAAEEGRGVERASEEPAPETTPAAPKRRASRATTTRARATSPETSAPRTRATRARKPTPPAE